MNRVTRIVFLTLFSLALVAMVANLSVAGPGCSKSCEIKGCAKATKASAEEKAEKASAETKACSENKQGLRSRHAATGRFGRGEQQGI